MIGVVLLLFVGALATFWVMSERRDEHQLRQEVRLLEYQRACIHAAHDFAYVVLQNHQELIAYDEELRELAERVATTREDLHRAVQKTDSDGYRSPLRELLP